MQGGEPGGEGTACESFECEQGLQGCTLGYWKNHLDSWAATGYSPNMQVGSVFTLPAAYSSLGSATLLGALEFKGGPQPINKAALLLKQAVAGLLSAAHPNVNYATNDPQDVINAVNTALTQGVGPIQTLQSQIDSDNNAGCPLN